MCDLVISQRAICWSDEETTMMTVCVVPYRAREREVTVLARLYKEVVRFPMETRLS
jgi:hypothetical protein